MFRGAAHRRTESRAGVRAGAVRRRSGERRPTAASPHSTTPTPLVPSAPVRFGATLLPTLTVMSGFEAGRVIRLGARPLTVGRDPVADVRLEDPGLSRTHARIAPGPDGDYYIRDLGSRNGTLVASSRIDLARLKPGDLLQLGAAVLRFEQLDGETLALREHLHEASLRDPLTGLFNRRHFVERLQSAMSEARQGDGEISVVMVDVDHFKQFNDRFGHLPGDRALSFIAAQLARTAGDDGLVARWGGEEFVVLATASRADAIELARKLRQRIGALPFSVAKTAVWFTVSLGVASLSELDPADEPAALVRLADERMYAAKLAGRNRVQID